MTQGTLAGQTALVTGATRGIGRVLALALAASRNAALEATRFGVFRM